jgi:plastocyanin
MSQHENQNAPARPDLMGEMRFKIPLPIVIPIVSLVVIAGVTIGMSRILLALEPEAATVVALAIAANVLGGCAYYALRPRMSQASKIELLAVVLYPVIIGVAIAQIGFGGSSEATEGEHGAPAEGGASTSVVAEGVAFTTSTITLAAGEDVALEFDNKDTTAHNIAIYEDEGAEKVIFDGPDVQGPGTTTYEFTAPPKGEYYFQCDLHPNMNGTVKSE